MVKRKCIFVMFVFIILLLGGCSKKTVYSPAEPYWEDNDRQKIEKPAKRSPLLVWQLLDRTAFAQAEQFLDLNRSLGQLSGNEKQAWNINSFDEVPNSSWFTNRHGMNPLSGDEISAGYQVTGGPDTSGPWTVFRPKVGGVTAGFWIKDSRGDAYIIKFDPPNNPEMATAAAAMTGRLFYACGYNVPQETITQFYPDDLVINEGVTYKDAQGNKHPFTREKLNEILTKAYHNKDGSIRCLASLALPNILGPFSFDGKRKDDPNDWCRHEHRRELRALYVFCSFVNHWDIKDENSMDIFIGDDDTGYIEHFLLDFGSTMGSAGHGPQDPRSGYANSFDLLDALVSFFTLGLKKWQWENVQPYNYPSIGYFESDIFHPAKWDPIYPIPAFENMTGRDAFWATKIILSFSDQDLKALIDAGQLSDPEAREYLFKTLKIRRDRIGRHWFGKVNPLDNFSFERRAENLELSFEDLGLKFGFNAGARQEHKYTVSHLGKSILTGTTTDNKIVFDESATKSILIAWQLSETDLPETHLYKIEIKSIVDGKKRSHPVNVWLWYDNQKLDLFIVGIEHED